MSAPGTGFALMQFSSILDSAYEASPFAKNAEKELKILRNALPFIKPDQYRGIGRYPFNADYAYDAPGWQWADKDAPISQDEIARARLREILGIQGEDVPEESWLIDGPWLLPELSYAREVLKLLSSLEKYEIVEVARFPFRAKGVSLGFDVGYWASGNFSLICDCAIWPLWHPPVLDVFKELARHLSCVNSNGLFPTIETGLSFRDYYRSQNWTETEDDKFRRFELIEVAEARH